MTKMANGLITTLTRANNTSESLRTTVPSGIVKILRLNEGDKINWDFKAEDNNIVVIVKPEKGEKRDVGK